MYVSALSKDDSTTVNEPELDETDIPLIEICPELVKGSNVIVTNVPDPAGKTAFVKGLFPSTAPV